jgi:hypothetical protein
MDAVCENHPLEFTLHSRDGVRIARQRQAKWKVTLDTPEVFVRKLNELHTK